MKLADLKLLYGGMFSDYLAQYTHWGWIDIDCVFGDMTPLMRALKHYDVTTFPDGVCSVLVNFNFDAPYLYLRMSFLHKINFTPCKHEDSRTHSVSRPCIWLGS